MGSQEGRSTCLPPRFDNPGYCGLGWEVGRARGRGGREGGVGWRPLCEILNSPLFMSLSHVVMLCVLVKE